MDKKELRDLLIMYLAYDVECSYINLNSEYKRVTAFLTGMSKFDGIETTYKRKRKGVSGDYIMLTGHNNVDDLGFKLHLRPLGDYVDLNLPAMIDLNCDMFNQMEICNFAKKRDLLEHLHVSTLRIMLIHNIDVAGMFEAGYAKKLTLKRKIRHCQCNACKDGVIHSSDCAVHNEPAFANGECNCERKVK